MNLSKPMTTLAITLLAGAAQAQAIRITIPEDLPLAAPTTTRAEVIADFHVWRLSGLQELDHGEIGPEPEALSYRRAQARYQRLRASPQFAGLVAELQNQPNATVLVRK